MQPDQNHLANKIMMLVIQLLLCCCVQGMRETGKDRCKRLSILYYSHWRNFWHSIHNMQYFFHSVYLSHCGLFPIKRWNIACMHKRILILTIGVRDKQLAVLVRPQIKSLNTRKE